MGLTLAGATALSAGLNFLGGLGTNQMNADFNAAEAQKNRDFQKEMYEKQYQDNLNFWKMQNEYNLPSAQLARLREAGLNPLLAYGEGSLSGNIASQAPQSAQAPHGAQASVNMRNPVDMANLALLEAQVKNINADTEQKQSVARGNNIMSDINEATKDVQIAMKYGQNDLLSQSIRNMSAALINEGMVTAEQCATLAQGRIYQIKHFNLSETQVGNDFYLGLENIKNGRIQANAASRQAAAALQNAFTAANISKAQIGLLVKQAANWQLQNDYLEKTLGSRVFQATQFAKEQYWKATAASWAPLLNEVGISKTQSEIFLNTLKGGVYEYQQNQIEQNMLLQPAGMMLDWKVTP